MIPMVEMVAMGKAAARCHRFQKICQARRPLSPPREQIEKLNSRETSDIFQKGLPRVNESFVLKDEKKNRVDVLFVLVAMHNKFPHQLCFSRLFTGVT